MGTSVLSKSFETTHLLIHSAAITMSTLHLTFLGLVCLGGLQVTSAGCMRTLGCDEFTYFGNLERIRRRAENPIVDDITGPYWGNTESNNLSVYIMSNFRLLEDGIYLWIEMNKAIKSLQFKENFRTAFYTGIKRTNQEENVQLFGFELTRNETMQEIMEQSNNTYYGKIDNVQLKHGSDVKMQADEDSYIFHVIDKEAKDNELWVKSVTFSRQLQGRKDWIKCQTFMGENNCH